MANLVINAVSWLWLYVQLFAIAWTPIIIGGAIIGLAARVSPTLHVWLAHKAGYADHEISMEGF